MAGPTAGDFKLLNSNPDFAHMVEMALKYGAEQDPRLGQIMQMVADNHTTIMFNPPGNPAVAPQYQGHSVFSGPSNMVLWNPYSAMLVWETDPATGQKYVTGIQSAADGLIHEFLHALDPQQQQNSQTPDKQYENAGERVAVTIESVINMWIGEPGRNNHDGIEIPVLNPTLHTFTTEDGALQLTWTGADGKPVYGPQISLNSPQWQRLQDFGRDAAGSLNEHDNDPVPNEHDNDPYPNEHDNDPVPNEHDNDPYPNEHDNDPTEWTGGGGGGGGACVAVSSFLPDGRTAGEIKVGDTMELGDQETMEAGKGVVSFSKFKQAPGFRITTEKGVSLVCSDTAPIPTKGKGLLTPEKLLGEQVAVRWDENGQTSTGWETIVKVESVGIIHVQHITVGDKCFWAGEKKGAYILHHNLKDAGNGGGYDNWPWPDEYDPFKAEQKPDQSHQTTHHGNHGTDPALIVGVAPPVVVDGIGQI